MSDRGALGGSPHPGPAAGASKVRQRMRFAPSALVAGGLGFAVSCLAACGGGAGLLSGDQAGTLSNQLDQVSSAVQSGNCATATSASNALVNQVSNLPSTVNSTVRANLAQGATTVSQLATQQCRTATTATTTKTATTATTTPATTTQTTQNTSSTTTPTTPPTATTPTTSGSTSTAPSGGGGLGGGGTGTGGGASPGNGNGNGQ